MDLHDFEMVAKHYDSYVKALAGEAGHKDFVHFHLGLAEAHGHDGILDIACGTGRIAIPLMKAGYTVSAFDVSEAMIRRFRSNIQELDPLVGRRAALSIQNMVDFTYSRKFSLAMIPASGFMHLLTPADQRRTLSNINRHLNMDGVLTLNTFDPDLHHIASHSSNAREYRKRAEFDTTEGHAMEIFDAMTYDPAQQTMQGVWRFIEYDDERRILNETEMPLRMRYTFRQEMQYLLELAGFRVDELYGSYDKSRPRYPSPLIWIARKVGEPHTF